jgi:hypothetical protein
MVPKGGFVIFLNFLFLSWPRGYLVILKNKYYKKTINGATHVLAHAGSSDDQNQPSTMMFGVAHCPLRISEVRVEQ